MTAASLIDGSIQIGEPIVHRGAAVHPLFPRRPPVARYVTLEDALPHGFAVTEVDASGSVPELRVRNPLDTAVLLYDGEELVGAKQNRILDVTVLVPAGSELPIPVSCVEQGRWSRRSEMLSAARHAAYPDLRRRKAEVMARAEMLARSNAVFRGLAQREVWDAVADKLERHQISSPTMAQADLYAVRERDLAGLRDAFPLQQGQCGAILALPGAAASAGGDGPGHRDIRPAEAGRLVLDYVSRPDAFARLYPKLLDGYLLDALERLDGEPVDTEPFLPAIGAAQWKRGPSAGLGEDVRLAGDGIVGSGLALDGELVQLSAYAADRPEASGYAARISRPSRRR